MASYTVTDFERDFAIEEFSGIASETIQFAINFVESKWNDFCHIPSCHYVTAYGLAVAHYLVGVNAVCANEEVGWFGANVQEIKTYNDTVKYTSDNSYLSTSKWGIQLKALLESSINKVPFIYPSGCC